MMLPFKYFLPMAVSGLGGVTMAVHLKNAEGFQDSTMIGNAENATSITNMNFRGYSGSGG